MPPAVFADLLSRASGDLVRRFSPRHRTLFLSRANIRPFLVPRNWSAEEVAPLFTFSTFDQFLATFAFTGSVINGPADIERLAHGVLAAVAADGIVYAEVTVSAREYARRGVPLPALLAVLDDAARRTPLRVQWIIDLVRDFGAEAGQELVTAPDRWRPPSVVGITIGGSEHRFPPRAFSPVYRAARAVGLRLSAHAGEGLGPASVWDALDRLGVDRIGHGVRAVVDPRLVRQLASRQLPLEVCPTSNLATGLYAGYASHPLRALLEQGVPVSVNSDGPAFFAMSLSGEFAALERAGLPRHMLVELARNGFRHAFLPAAERTGFLTRFDGAWSGASVATAGG